MITIIFLIILFPVIAGVTVGVVVKGILEREKTKELETKPNYDVIAKLDKELFGVGVEINGLPGCWWRVQRGCTQRVNDGPKKDDPDGFSIWLMDKDSNELANAAVAKMRSMTILEMSDRRQRGIRLDSTLVEQSPEEMDAAIQTAMKGMVEKEIAKRQREQAYNDIIVKYNGKKVDQ